MNIDEDTCQWLGCPTPLEMYQHQCAMLEDEIADLRKDLRAARENIHGLIQMNDDLVTVKADIEDELKKALDNIARINLENSELGRKINSLEIVASQRDYLSRENQRLLLEMTVLRGPQP
ncbi:hypothetical protein ACJ6YJ_03645 [Pseudomonas marginalis]|uniref:hypothetical protein n=1 Tax=Pseudomonas TaxID=286 RepID=UPI00389A8A83